MEQSGARKSLVIQRRVPGASAAAAASAAGSARDVLAAPLPYRVIEGNNVDGANPGYGPTIGMAVLPSAPTTNLNRKETELSRAQTFKKESQLPSLTMTKSLISLYSWEEMKRLAGQVVMSNSNFDGTGSVNDPRMGTSSLNTACWTCWQIDCAGHYGLIDFKTMIYNPAFINDIVAVLTCVCNDCGALLVTEKIIKDEKINRQPYDKRLGALKKRCDGQSCFRPKQPIAGGLVRSCRKNPVYSVTDLKDKGVITYKAATEKKSDSKGEPVQIKRINDVWRILDMISAADAQLLGFPATTHPRNMIIQGILVTPIIARPPVVEGGVVHHDQFTTKYVEIYKRVANLTSDDTSALYACVRELIFDSDAKKVGLREFQSIVMRLQGKEGIPRKFMMGKRNNYCGRTVSGPGPTLRFGEVGIPSVWAPVLTKKIKVTNFNIAHLTALLAAGRITHITMHKTGLRKFVGQVGDFNTPFKYHLQIGDMVDRWLENGDRIVVNRQPTLHRQSMMGYKVVLTNNLTINLHLSYTTPMNNDFDGDENNAWNPRDFEVESEVESLMNVTNNIMSSEQNLPIMGLVMNSVSGAFLMSDPTTRIDDDLFSELLDLLTSQSDISSLSYRLRKYGINPRSGQAMISAMLPADFYYEMKGVVIMEGVLISGRLGKGTVGVGHRSIIQELYKKYGSQRTANFFTDATWIFNKWLVERGFSIGLSDIVNLGTDSATKQEYDKSARVLKQELAKIFVQLDALGPAVDDPIEENFRMQNIKTLVDNAQGIGQRLAKEVLKGDNSIGVMSEVGGGAKGKIANIGQMLGSVGQQFYRGKRLQPTITNGTRLLPTYDENDEDPEANAFIPVSFFTGLSPQGLFFLQAGGREGILDTALNTALTGSMQHRMIKAFENIIIGYDGSVRNTIGTVFSPMYNAGYDIGEMVSVDTPGKENFSSFMDIKSMVAELNKERGWIPTEVAAKISTSRDSLPIMPDNVLPDNDYVHRPPVIDQAKSIDLTPLAAPINVPIKITRFEKTRIIGTRAMQLSNNAPPLIDIGDEIDPVTIATKEFEAGLLQIYVVRRYADGSRQLIYPTLENISV
jgi:DNA-directed RNA polymerase II subunit RPB1